MIGRLFLSYDAILRQAIRGRRGFELPFEMKSEARGVTVAHPLGNVADRQCGVSQEFRGLVQTNGLQVHSEIHPEVAYSNNGGGIGRAGEGRERWNNNSIEMAVIPINH